VNEQSLNESNAILSAAAQKTETGQFISATPAQLAAEGGIDNRLSIARAIRALLARGRIAQEGNRYRLLDAKPIEPNEPATVRRPIRRRRGAERPVEKRDDGPPTYDQLGRAVIDRVIELSAEASELRAALDRSRGEAEAARREAVEVTQRAAGDRRRSETLEDEANALRRRLEMTETNLRTVVEVAKNRPASPLEDTDARAILNILSRKEGNGE